jgi:hypothetical protein
MVEIPDWLKQSIEKYSCPHCTVTMVRDRVVGVGIRMSTKYKDKSVFFFEYDCEKCENRVFVELDFMTVEDFVMSMLDEYTGPDGERNDKTSKKTGRANKKATKSKIQDAEVLEMKDFLKKCSSGDDLLTAMGFSTETIEQYKRDGRKEYLQNRGKRES